MSDADHVTPEEQSKLNDTLDDLDVRDEQAADVSGGAVSTGGSGGEDRLTENVTLKK